MKLPLEGPSGEAAYAVVGEAYEMVVLDEDELASAEVVDAIFVHPLDS